MFQLHYKKEIIIQDNRLKLFNINSNILKKLIDRCFSLQAESNSKPKCNLTGWRSSWYAHHDDQFVFEFSNYLCKCLKDYNIHLQTKETWFAVYELGDMCFEHDHGTSQPSGVLYLEVGNKQSPLVFDNIGLFFSTGDFILFPGHLRHYVPRTNDRRIILAFNFIKDI